MNDLKTYIINVSGKNIDSFFQNLITNDINKLKKANILYTALLSPQGKFLNDFFIIKRNESFLIECSINKADDLINNFKKYDLRNDVNFAIENKYATKVIMFDKLNKNLKDKFIKNNFYETEKFICFLDPRLKNYLARFWFKSDKSIDNDLNYSKYEEIEPVRIRFKIPNSEKDLLENKSFILNYNFEKINAISFEKGCFIGQENTARQKYRGTQKYSLKAIELLDGVFLENNADIYIDQKKVGTMKSSFKNLGLCLFRNDVKLNKLRVITDNNMSFRFI